MPTRDFTDSEAAEIAKGFFQKRVTELSKSLEELGNVEKTEDLCKKCGKSHDLQKACLAKDNNVVDLARSEGAVAKLRSSALAKAILTDAKGKVKDNGIHPDSVLPEDKDSEEVSADGSGGQIKKGKGSKGKKKDKEESSVEESSAEVSKSEKLGKAALGTPKGDAAQASVPTKPAPRDTRRLDPEAGGRAELNTPGAFVPPGASIGGHTVKPAPAAVKPAVKKPAAAVASAGPVRSAARPVASLRERAMTRIKQFVGTAKSEVEENNLQKAIVPPTAGATMGNAVPKIKPTGPGNKPGPLAPGPVGPPKPPTLPGKKPKITTPGAQPGTTGGVAPKGPPAGPVGNSPSPAAPAGPKTNKP
jgi:hypothetical protein